MTEFCIIMGIQRQLTVPYTPQQNGVAERMNRTIIERAKSMLAFAGMADRFWAEAVHTAVHIGNRLETKATGKTPYELWNSRVPNISHVKVFGSGAWSHIPLEKRAKLDDKALQCVMVGYSDTSKAYRLYHEPTDRVFVSRDVTFDERHLGLSGSGSHVKLATPQSVEMDIHPSIMAPITEDEIENCW